MKFLITLTTLLVVALLIVIPTAYAASSSSSSSASADNGGTSVAISSSQSTGDGVAVSNSNADSTKGGSATAVSSSAAKNGEVVISNSNAVSQSPNNIVKTTTINGVTTSTSSTSSNTQTNNNFFNYASNEIKKIENENVNIVNTSNPLYVYTEKVIVNGTTIYIFNPTNLTNLQVSDVLVSPNVTVDIPKVTSETSNGSNLTYSISTGDSNKPPSFVQMILNLFHL